MQLDEFCRQVERYLCQKNDGHLIRVVGPSFDLVAGWAARGVPLKIVFSGIDRCFERYYRKGARRRPVRIDFCEADVLDAFDEWRRAVGLPAGALEADHAAEPDLERSGRRGSLQAHLQRAIARMTAARARGSIGDAFDGLIDLVSHELDVARASGRGPRGEGRAALLERLSGLDLRLLEIARAALDGQARAALAAEATMELERFRDRMDPDAFARARDAAFDRLLRERFDLPTLTYGF